MKSDKLAFELKYLDEDGAWKLIAIHVSADKAGKGDKDGE